MFWLFVLTRCGGYHIGPVTVEWAKNHTQYSEYMLKSTVLLGLAPELRFAPSVEARWVVMRTLLKQLHVESVLDVGGIGNYRHSVKRYTCINVPTEPRAARAFCNIYEGSVLPFPDNHYELTLAESTLHHAGSNASKLMWEMARVAKRYVVVGEDILEPSMASRDVVEAFEEHDHAAQYRTLEQWSDIGVRSGLRMERVLVLHRVPLHLRPLANCNLGYAPMVYFVWSTSH